MFKHLLNSLLCASVLFVMAAPAAFSQTAIPPKTATGGPYVSPTGVLVAKGQTVTITGTGTMTMSYIGGGFLTCDPHGDIIMSPGSDSPAYAFFTNEPPTLEPPGSGDIKFPSSGGLPQATGAVPYGGLEAGISVTAGAGSAANFPNGFFGIGFGSSFVAPITGYLYLAIQTNTNVVASGSYTAMITISGGGSGGGGGTGNGPVQAVDPADTLFVGNTSTITTDPLLLASGGRPVFAVAADGLAEVVIRVSASSSAVPVVVLLDENGNFAPTTGEDGTLSNLAGGALLTSSTAVPAFHNINGANEGFVVYTPPVDYARDALDNATAGRLITLLEYDTATSSVIGSQTLQILRPPIFFVHGLWGEPSTWDEFDPFLTKALPGLVTYRADFSQHNGDGVDFNTPNILNQAYNKLADFRTTNQAAAAQLDFIVHSMGGLISDTMPSLPYFKTPNNYGHGVIHRLITVDTPYQGSQLAIGAGSSSVACKLILYAAHKYVGDAIRDLIPGSTFLQNFNPVPPGYPKHAIASYVTVEQAQGAEAIINVVWAPGVVALDGAPEEPCYAVFKNGSVAPPTFTFNSYYAPSGDPYGGANDLIVSEVSQLGPFVPGTNADRTSGLAHSHLPIPLILNFSLPGSLDAGIGSPVSNPGIALGLLNTSVKSSVFIQ
jgi:PGAP1-like protein